MLEPNACDVLKSKHMNAHTLPFHKIMPRTPRLCTVNEDEGILYNIFLVRTT